MSTKYFDNSMAGAPALTGEVDSLCALLYACLVTGFGSTAASTLIVAGGIATLTFPGAHPFKLGGVALVAGSTVTGGTAGALNGEKRVLSVTGTTVTFDATGVSNQTATGTITAKVAGAGWTRPYSGTNKACFRGNHVDGTGCFLRVDDSNAQYGKVQGYESMSDVDSGVNPFPTVAQWATGLWVSKSNAASSSARDWIVIADDRAFMLAVKNAPSSYEYSNYFFGDIQSLRSNDAYSCLLSANNGDRSASYGSDNMYTHDPARSYLQSYMARAANALGSSEANYTCAGSCAGIGAGAFLGAAGTPYPSPVNNGLVLGPMVVHSASGIRGTLPGIYSASQITSNSFANRDVIDGTGDFVGKKLVVIKMGPIGSAGVLFFDFMSDWRA